MKFNKLHIKGFGKYVDVTLDFSPNFNVVAGSNESGKTTIQAFIKAMLFSLKEGRGTRKKRLLKYKPWKSDIYEGALEYTLDNGKMYRIERNFNSNTVKIYDSLFNDITSTFESSKKTGAIFTKKHFNLNKEGFEGTVFIEQMGTRLGSEEKKELLDRIVNVNQTGFDNISYQKAYEALSDALKIHVGNEKTSTRPLDVINNKLDKLRKTRNDLVQDKNNKLNTNARKKDVIFEIKELESKKQILQEFKNALKVKKDIVKQKNTLFNFKKSIDSIETKEQELEDLNNKVLEYSKLKRSFSHLIDLNDWNEDEIIFKYQKMVELIEKNKSLEIDINKKSEELEGIEYYLEAFRIFKKLDSGIEGYLIDLNKQIESLRISKTNLENNSFESMDEELSSLIKKDKMLNGALVAAFLVGVGLLFLKNISINLLIGTGIAITVELILKYIILSKKSKIHSKNQEREAQIDQISNEIAVKESELKKLFDSVGVESFDSFIRAKFEYENKILKFEEINEALSLLDDEAQYNLTNINKYKEQILDTLIKSDILDDKAYNFSYEEIKKFTFQFNKYNALDKDINTFIKNINDIEKYLEDVYCEINTIYSLSAYNRSDILNEIKNINSKVKDLKLELDKQLENIRKMCIDKKLEDFCGISELVLSENIEKVENSLDMDLDSLINKINTKRINLKEIEFSTNSITEIENKIELIDEEIEMTKKEKERLEELKFSLSTAIQVLNEVSDEIQKETGPIFNSKMSEVLNFLTAGKYLDLKLDSDMNLKAVEEEYVQVVDSALLSGGTIDQIYLSLRIAAAEVIESGSESLPFLMDEIFAQYDDDRIENTFKLFNEITRKKQVILFTCKRRELEIAKKIIGDSLNVINLDNII